MNPLIAHERFEMETLEGMQRMKVLDRLIFCGGTMLRVCYRLDRYSVDLDFYLKPHTKQFSKTFDEMAAAFRGKGLEITDHQVKHATYLMEIRSVSAPRRLKIEIRKDPPIPQETELAIAYSEHAPEIQVRVTATTLAQMWRNKIEALVNRREIRDAYDLEFLLRRGAGRIQDLSEEVRSDVLKIIMSFTKQDFRSTLGSLLPPESRKMYEQGKFSLLESELRALA